VKEKGDVFEVMETNYYKFPTYFIITFIDIRGFGRRVNDY
jgi:hypothetical protein